MGFLIGAKAIASAKDLKGKVVGISALGTQPIFLIVRLLRGLGLNPDKDVTLRPIGDEGLRLQAISTGLVHAALHGCATNRALAARRQPAFLWRPVKGAAQARRKKHTNSAMIP
jgi:ABC-type nitrate/sulfonate/bicarbonate transport system substrate-binding protein